MESCVRIRVDAVEEVEELTCLQEEADTRLLLHASHVAQFQYKSMPVHLEDTDVHLLCIAFSSQIAVPMLKSAKHLNKNHIYRHNNGSNLFKVTVYRNICLPIMLKPVVTV